MGNQQHSKYKIPVLSRTIKSFLKIHLDFFLLTNTGSWGKNGCKSMISTCLKKILPKDVDQ